MFKIIAVNSETALLKLRVLDTVDTEEYTKPENMVKDPNTGLVYHYKELYDHVKVNREKEDWDGSPLSEELFALVDEKLEKPLSITSFFKEEEAIANNSILIKFFGKIPTPVIDTAVFVFHVSENIIELRQPIKTKLLAYEFKKRGELKTLQQLLTAHKTNGSPPFCPSEEFILIKKIMNLFPTNKLVTICEEAEE